jgi:hypothetical protein
MSKAARYESITPQTDEEKLLLARIEDLEALCDKFEAGFANHRHDSKDNVVIDATWLF